MKKVLLIIIPLFVLLISFSKMKAQEIVCEIDSSLVLETNAGVFPDTLADAAVGEPFSQTLQFILPSDTSVLGLSVAFCSFQLVETDPPLDALGLEVICNDSACIFTVDPRSSTNRNCAVIQGTPTFGLESLDVVVSAEIGILDADSNCIPSGLAPFEFPFTFQFNVADTITTSLEDLTLLDLGLSIFPNPAREQVTLEYTLPEAAEVSVEVFDIIGKKVYENAERKQAAGAYRRDIVFPSSSKGIYLFKIDLNKGERTFWQKVIRQ